MIGTNARRVKKIKALAERVGFESTHEGLADFFNFAIPLARLAFTPALLPDSTSYLGPIVPKLFPSLNGGFWASTNEILHRSTSKLFARFPNRR